MSIFRSSVVVGSLTLVSRVFGFLRDMMIAYMLGAGLQTDAFFVAFKLPNFMRRLFAEGAFNAAFLPSFAAKLKTQGKEEALRFASETYSYLTMVLLIVCTLAVIFMPWLMYALAPGFSHDPEKFELTITLTRITFPYLFFISLVCLQGGVLNSLDKFAAVAAAPIILNLTLIVSLVLLPPFTETPAHALSAGVFLAGLTQYLWLWYFLRKEGMLPRLLRPRLTPDVRKLLKLIAPAAVGAGVVQINLLVDVILASLLGHAVSFLYYADRIYELPLGVIGIASATALLPMLSKAISVGDKAKAQEYTDQSIILVLLLGMPATAALLTISTPIVQFVFERGAFGAHETAMVAPALAAFGAGLPAFLLAKIFASVFFASHDTKTPVKVAILCVFINFIFNIILMQFIGHVGIATATTISGWVNATALGWILYKRGMWQVTPPVKRFAVKCLLSCVAMVLVLLALTAALHDWLANGEIKRIIAIAALVGLGGLTYFAAMFATKAITLAELKRWFRKEMTPSS